MKKLIFFSFGIFLSIFLYAQNLSKDAYSKSLKLYDEKKYAEAINSFENTLKYAKTENVISTYYAACYNYIGLANLSLTKFPEAIRSFEISADAYYKIKEYDNYAVLLKNIGITYQNMELYRNQIYKDYDSSEKVGVYFKVKEILSQNQDSAIISIDYGTFSGLYTGSTGGLITSYTADKNDKKRANIVVGNSILKEVNNSKSKAIVYFSKSYKNFKILPGDLLFQNVYKREKFEKNIFTEFATLDIIIKNNKGDIVIDKNVILNNTDTALEEKLLTYFHYLISTFPIADYATDSVLLGHYLKGRFEGNNTVEAYKKTSIYDVRAFLDFVLSYPAKYMGNEWSLNEIYATWVINNSMLGDHTEYWVLPAILKEKYYLETNNGDAINYYMSMDTNLLINNKIRNMIYTDSIAFSKIALDYLYNMYESKNNHKQIPEINYIYSSYFAKIKDVDEALEKAKLAYNADKENANYEYQLASVYGDLKKYPEAISHMEKVLKKYPDFINGVGILGWYYTANEEIEKAIPLCKRAYEYDTSVSAFIVNYGHTFLLNGETDSARKYYIKALQHIQSPEEYTEGAKKDFEIFFIKGWQRKIVAEEADKMDLLFENIYKKRAQGNVEWLKAKEFYKNKNYTDAIKSWKLYLDNYVLSEEKINFYTRNTYTWIATSWKHAKNYDSALYYYNQALHISKNHLSLEMQAEDIDRINDLFTTLNNEKAALPYKLQYDALSEKIMELNAKSEIYLLAISGDENSPKKIHQKSSQNFIQSFQNFTKKNQTTLHVFSYITDVISIDSIKYAFDKIKMNAKPEDIFIYYYSGEIENEFAKGFKLDTKGNEIYSFSKFLKDINSIAPTKKIILNDANSSAIISEISSEYAQSGLRNEDLLFMCSLTPIPMPGENGNSLFSNALSNALQQHILDTFSIKNWMDKAALELGRGNHYYPVFALSFGKDIIIKTKNIPKSNPTQNITRGGDFEEELPLDAKDKVDENQKQYALLFATNEYKEFSQLVNPISDAQELGKMLEEDFGFIVEIVSNPTLAEMESKLKSYRDKKLYGQNDQLFIFFAGHGIYNEQDNMGYLVCKDSKKVDEQHRSFLSYSDLNRKYISNIKCNRIFTVFDACFAGSYFYETTGQRGDDMAINKAKMEMVIKRSQGKRFYKALSSGGKEYVDDGKAGQNSPFAGSFLRIAKSLYNSNDFISADEIIAKVKNEPLKSTPNSGIFKYTDADGQFIFIAKTKTTNGLVAKKTDVQKK